MNIGGATVTGSTVDLSNYSISVGDSIECTASVSDSHGGSATSSSATVVENRSPSISSVSISPSSPGSQDVLTCSVTSSDLDGETLTESMEWFVAGSSCIYWNDFEFVFGWCWSMIQSSVSWL